MYNPDNQHRCDIIRSRVTSIDKIDDILPAYASLIADICPTDKTSFRNSLRDGLSNILFGNAFSDISGNNQKTVDNHRTEIAGQLFGMYYEEEGYIYESDVTSKLLEDNDQPAFFKNLCLNFQHPNGTQKIKTIQQKIKDGMNIKPFHFILSLLKEAKKGKVTLKKTDIGYYVLNSKEVLSGEISVLEVLSKIQKDRKNNIIKKIEITKNPAYDKQHITGQINLLVLANLVRIEGSNILINHLEKNTIALFISQVPLPLNFDISKYNLYVEEDKIKFKIDWSQYYTKVNLKDPSILDTSIQSLQNLSIELEPQIKKGVNHNIVGDAGEEYVFLLEKERVRTFSERLVNKVISMGKQRGLGYDVLSIEAGEGKDEPEFARFIEVKSTTRTTAPCMSDVNLNDSFNLTRKEWVAAKQYRLSYNIYRVFFTSNGTIVRKINDPYGQNEQNIITVLPTSYRMDFGSNCIDKEY
jgi:hypothetical protein